MFRFRSVFRVSLIMACASSLGPATSLAQGVTAVSPTPSILTSGSGEAKVTPDRAAVMVNVQTRAATAAAAASENARRTTAVLDAIGKLGLPKSQLATEGYSVNPEMVYGS